MGWSRVQMNMEDTLRNWFSEDVPQQSPLAEFSQPMDPNRPSSSSSSLKSLSMDSPETSPFLFNIPTTPHISELPQDPTLQPIPTTSTAIQQVILRSLQPIQATTTSPLQYSMQCLQPLQTTATSPLQCSMQSLQPIPSAISPTPHQQVMHAFALVRNTQLPTQESEDAVMARAILAVLTSPSSSTSSSTPNLRQRATAFKKYGSLPTTTTATRLAGLHSQSLLKRAINYYRNLTIVRREHMQASRSTPTSSQMHHMISERRRREKINESFEALRKLLPPEAKKDKASVLTRTREYLTSLKAQVAELSQRNQQLEAQALLPAIEITEEVSESSNERVEVRVALVSESTPEGEERIIDLQVFVRGGSANISNIVIGILEFLKHDRNVNLMSMEATTSATESRLLNRVILRLRIEGNEWEESAFQEAVRRIVADLTH
ncbi:hypothetical protein JCGZ_07417 [Jatropha curcas]|uniref:BHLH domain-containing protein n=2 Tax=Jatropha curcas TaxID=180498 RepID=A0A067KCA6_JATCU|nr:hypothetical protein JCGZ_07417 [Jatropha curcas]